MTRALDRRCAPRQLVRALVALQWTGFIFPIVAGHVVVAAAALQLTPADTVDMFGRVLFVVGALTVIQPLAGHRMPIFEAPAAVYLAVLITVAASAEAAGWAPSRTLAAIEGALLVVGVLVVCLGVARVASRVAVAFTRLVTATFMLYLGVQLLAPVAALAIARGPGKPWGTSAAWLALTVMVAAFAALRRSGRLRPVTLLLTLAVGWLVYGLLSGVRVPEVSGWSLDPPDVLAWGAPIFEGLVVLPFAVAGFFGIINTLASLGSMALLDDRRSTRREIDGGIVGNGLSVLAMGAFAGLGTTPHTSSVGVVKATRAGSPLAVAVAGALLALIASVPAAIHALASIPRPVASGLVLVSLWLVFVLGAREHRALLREPGRPLHVALIAVGTAAGWLITASGALARPSLLDTFLRAPLLVATSLALIVEVTRRVTGHRRGRDNDARLP